MLRDDSQFDLFEAPIFEVRSNLLDKSGHAPTFIIGCSSKKASSVSKAIDLYRSKRFLKAKLLAETMDADIFIASGKHGLVPANERIEPYDLDLSSKPSDEIEAWGNKIALEMSNLKGAICVLSDKTYSTPILEGMAARDDRGRVTAPLADVPKKQHHAWLDQATAFGRRVKDLDTIYRLIDQFRTNGRTFALEDLPNQKIPERGVYVFLDPSEKNFRTQGPRIVRIGTHAISEGSKATLRSRLRNHMGLQSGLGNHRGSIFRLHVGRALLESAGSISQLSSWGQGQSASKQVQNAEANHERRVSEYLGNLEVFIVEIDDAPNKRSLRASVERQLIALCSENLLPIDVAGTGWLGRKSPMKLIAKSGLWNLRDVGSEYDPAGRGSVTEVKALVENAA